MGNLTLDFSGRTVLVTGPARGVGNAFGNSGAHRAALAGLLELGAGEAR